VEAHPGHDRLSSCVPGAQWSRDEP
jgi:hypothetical protein